MAVTVTMLFFLNGPGGSSVTSPIPSIPTVISKVDGPAWAVPARTNSIDTRNSLDTGVIVVPPLVFVFGFYQQFRPPGVSDRA